MAPEIIRQLGPHSYYFEACAGSMSVLLAKKSSEHETVCDLHGALTNLAWVIQNETLAVGLFNRLQRVLYSDQLYHASKRWLGDHEDDLHHGSTEDQLKWAYHYFIASWMGRNGVAGTARINYQIATRWTPNGGSGPLRFRNAVSSIPAWCERLRNVHILRRDVFDVLTKIDDTPATAIYADPPYLSSTVSRNSNYVCDFAEGDHGRLAEALARFIKARVVVSYYDDPQLQQLYPRSRWTHIDCSRHKHLHMQNKRGSKRLEAPEVLLVNGDPVVEQDGGLFA